LLGLNEQAAQALNTRVIGMAHARALAAVPEALQTVATEYVVAEVKKDESPATTRQIENQLRALTAFLDPERWLPNGEKVYKPQARNRLAVIRMLVRGPQAADRLAKGWARLRAFDMGYEKKNVLTANPGTVVEDATLYDAITSALGMRSSDAWQNHAHMEHKECITCVFSTMLPAQKEPGISVPCPRWKDKTLETCDGWIGGVDPLVIPAQDYYVRQELERAGALVNEPFAHATDAAAWLEAYDAAVLYLADRKQQKVEAETDGPRKAIAEFWAWQKTLPGEWLQHSQAHWCALCRYHEPMHDDAPCRFAQHPLTNNWGMSGTRPPGLVVLYSPTLMMLPRCEMFTAQQLPRIHQQPGFAVGEDKAARRRVLAWMKALKRRNSFPDHYGYPNAAWRGAFAWMPCNNDKYDWDTIAAWLLKHWDEIGDGGMATLMTALLYEVQAACDRKGHAEVELVDVRDGAIEPWMAVLFAERNERCDWPEGWLRPWMQKGLGEVFSQANTDAGIERL
jgi:hypothetical protein